MTPNPPSLSPPKSKSRRTKKPKVDDPQTTDVQTADLDSPNRKCAERFLPRDIPIASLSSHPRQAEIFDLPSTVAIESLARDMDRRGQQVAIEVLPDGRILKGHSRVAAAKLLGWSKIQAIVREDLTDETDILRELAVDNLQRKQLTPLAQARAWKAVVEAETQDCTPGDVIHRLEQETGKSFKTMRPYLAVLRLPRVFQHMFDEGKLGHREVARLLQRDANDRERIARQVEEGYELADLLRPSCRPPSRRQVLDRVLNALGGSC